MGADTTSDERPSRPWSHDIPEGPWDYIVIGSGMGGMTSAAVLAKLGRRVLVLEQHNIPGGFTQVFKRPGYRWDVGVHIVGEMSLASYPGRLMHELTGGHLEWESVGDVYDEFNFPDGFTIQVPSTPEGFRETLNEYFPSEAEAIDEYLARVRAASRAAAKFLQARALPRVLTPGGRKAVNEAAVPHLRATTAEVLASLTDDERLRAVLSAQWGYYGATPANSSFAMHALMVQHFLRGAYYPVGGAASIAHAMLGTVAEAGGWTAVRRSVERIIVRGGRVAGVRLEDGTEIPAERVISAAGAIPTSGMIEEGLPSKEAPYREVGPAHVSLYLGFTGDVANRGGGRHCQWFYEDWDMEIPSWEIDPAGPPGRAPVLFCSFPSLKDPNHEPGPDMRHTGEAITFVSWDAFARWSDTRWHRRGDEYDAFKDELTSRLLDQYLEHYPGLRPLVDHVEMSTPLSTNHFARSARGSIYGLGTEPGRFADRSLLPRTPIRGMYLGGADAGTPGVVGALSGGVMAAIAAEPLRGARFIQPLMRRPKG